MVKCLLAALVAGGTTVFSDGSARSADLGTGVRSPAIPVMADEGLFFASLTAGINALHAGAQHGFKAVDAPFGSLGGKITAEPVSRLIGVQVDGNLAGISSSWVDPKARASASAYVYGGGIHVFTRSVDQAKLGAFLTADWHDVGISRQKSMSVPSYIGGLEGQYALTSGILLRGRAGMGMTEFSPNAEAINQFNLATGTYAFRTTTVGIGVTWQVNASWRLGADGNMTAFRTQRGGVGSDFRFYEMGGFAEYRFDTLPLTARAEAAYLRYSEKNFLIDPARAHLDGMRAKLSLRYEFGETSRRPRTMVDEEFRSYDPVAGLR